MASLSHPRLIVIGASAGGVEALRTIVSELPADFAAAVLVVVHFPPAGMSLLPQILTRAGPLRAMHVQEPEPLHPSRIYIAPPDRHLLVTPGHVHLSDGPKESGMRPAADALFRSAARHYGPGVIAVVLSGNLNDGTIGLLAVRERGGVTIVQDPAGAEKPTMPQAAIDAGGAQRVLPLEEIPRFLITACGGARRAA